MIPECDDLFRDIAYVNILELQGLPVVCIQTLETWLHEFEQYHHVRFRLLGKMYFPSMTRSLSSFREYVLMGRPSKHFTKGQYAASNRRILPIRDIPARPFYVWNKPQNEKYALQLQKLFQQDANGTNEPSENIDPAGAENTP